jgi:hypothetical protein
MDRIEAGRAYTKLSKPDMHGTGIGNQVGQSQGMANVAAWRETRGHGPFSESGREVTGRKRSATARPRPVRLSSA